MKYEWSDEYGDVGPEYPELEREISKDQFRMRCFPGSSTNNFPQAALHNFSSSIITAHSHSSEKQENEKEKERKKREKREKEMLVNT